MSDLLTVIVKWENEDQLPETTDEEFSGIYSESEVIGSVGVRMYPYVEIEGKRYYLTGIG